MRNKIRADKIKHTYKVENYFSENKYKRIVRRPYKLVIIIMIFYFALNIYSIKREIKEAELYIENNTEYTDSSNKMNNESLRTEINSDDIKQIFDVIGGRNINRFYCDDSGAELSGKIENLKLIDEIEKNSILSKSYIKKIENKGSYYEFEISK